MLLTASLDGTVSVWDVDRRELYRHFGQHKGESVHVVVADDLWGLPFVLRLLS